MVAGGKVASRNAWRHSNDSLERPGTTGVTYLPRYGASAVSENGGVAGGSPRAPADSTFYYISKFFRRELQ